MNFEDAIRAGFELFNRRDWDRIAGGCLTTSRWSTTFRPAAIAHGARVRCENTEAAGDDAFADLRMEALEVRAAEPQGDLTRVAVRIRATASGGTSGVAVESEIGEVWVFRKDAAIRMEQFRTWDETLAAAGLA